MLIFLNINYKINNFIGNISDRINTTNPQLSAEQAIQRVASELNLGNAQNLTLLETVEKPMSTIYFTYVQYRSLVDQR